MAGVRSPRHFVRLNRAHRANLRVWQVFLEAFNSRILWMEGPVSSYDLELFTDAAVSTGYGAFLGGRGVQSVGLPHGGRQAS